MYLSSTFGETRSAHFHAGLDIKTWGREGYEVYASKSGILSKLITTNKGYGKAIYLKHNDGSYTVYAHLNRFNPKFQAIADSIRLKNYSYTFEAFLESEQITINQGDIIGFTGSTGIGPPHLHFEIRNNANQPINPLDFNFAVNDTVPPTFSSILVEPLEIDSRVNRSVYPQEIYPIKQSSDTTFFDTVFVDGKFGLSPYVYDGANSVNNKYAVYKTSLLLEGDTLYHEEITKFDFSEEDRMFLNRVSSPTSKQRKFQRLFSNENYSHPFQVKELELKKKISGLVTIVSEDHFGNRSVALVPIKSSRNKKYSKEPALFEYWTNNWISINDSINLDLTDFKEGVLWEQYSNQRILDYKKDANHTLSRIEPEKEYLIIAPDRSIYSFIEPNTYFDTVSFSQDWDTLKNNMSLEIGRPEYPTRKNIYVQIHLPEFFKDLPNRLLYHLNEDQDTSFVDSWVKGSTLHALIGEFGRFTVLSDINPPYIYRPRKVTLASGLETYTVQARDNLSGIDYKSAVITINGERGIPEYDYEDDTFSFYLPDFKISKSDTLNIQVKDNAGNFISKSFLLKN